MPEAQGQAPYNFVEMPTKILLADPVPERDRYHEGRRTGWIDLDIKAETPIYTRCAVRPEGNSEDFYHWGDPARPVIPGSNIRGAVRSLVEILSYSRLSRRELPRVGDEALMYRGVADQQSSVGRAYNDLFLGPNGDYPSQRVKAGYLEYDDSGWSIRPAKEYGGRSFTRVTLEKVRTLGFTQEQKTYHPVYVTPKPELRETGSGRVRFRYPQSHVLEKVRSGDLVEGVLVNPGPMRQKRLPVIYTRNPEAKAIPIPERMWNQYEVDRDLQRGIPNRRLEKPGDPLFYLVDERGQLIFFGPNMFFRLPYKKSPLDLVPVDTSEELDLAEAIFGTVTARHQQRGRVIFADAPGRSFTLLPLRSPEILASPKPTSYQYYVEQPRGADTPRSELQSFTSEAHRLRGFKRYWHRNVAELREPSKVDSEKASQYTKIRPVDKGGLFTGRVYFENLTDEELGCLLTALELPTSCRHHLGMGKPRGLGSVKMSLTQFTVVDPQKRYSHIETTGRRSDSEDIAQQAKKSFAKKVLEHAEVQGEDIWSIPRLRELKHLLEWDQKPEASKTSYLGLQQFKGKQPLPKPSEVRGATTTSTPESLARQTSPPSARAKESVKKAPRVELASVLKTDDRKKDIEFVNNKTKKRHTCLLRGELSPREIKDLRDKSVTIEWEGDQPVALLLGERRIRLE
jgi:CRISPR-associated protein (TIGR03986 family)